MNFNNKLIDFFKKHNLYNKDMFKYFSENCTIIDYKLKEQRMFIGTIYFVNKKNKKLEKIYLSIPYVYDDKTMLICIHEITHAILLFSKLGKKLELGIDYEALPMLYEKIYINEKNNPELTNYGIFLDNLIEEDDEQYVFGLKVRDELLNSYNYNINSMDKKVKKLARKYKK